MIIYWNILFYFLYKQKLESSKIVSELCDQDKSETCLSKEAYEKINHLEKIILFRIQTEKRAFKQAEH